ncbi:O-antigen ligase family protein [Natronorubrum sp. DTA7]|uniref:O-antigen ligase family protein n=1 Tax=Natronorubrum sp. DTA7 TaxID=3447016 RepID=UPI003F870546
MTTEAVFGGATYQHIGRMTGLGTVISAGYLIFSKKRISKIFYGLLMTIMFWLALISGSRAPVVAIVIAISVPIYYGVNFGEESKVYIRPYAIIGVILSTLAVLVLPLLLFLGISPTTIERFMALTGSDPGRSASARVEWYIQSVQAWMEAPLFGHGTSGWASAIGMDDPGGYPHNILLELMVEVGTIGTAFLITCTLYMYNMMKKTGIGQLQIFSLMIICYALINALLSGDLTTNRLLFAALGLLLVPNKG